MDRETKNEFTGIKNHLRKADKRFDQVDKRFDQVDRRLEQVDKRFEQVDRRFEEMDQKHQERTEEVKRHTGVLIESLEDKIQLVAEQQSSIVETLGHMGATLERIDGRLSGKVNQEEFETLENRVTILEQKK